MRYRARASVSLTASGSLARLAQRNQTAWMRSTITNRSGHSIWPREGRSFQPRRYVQLLRQLASSVDACRSSLHRCVDAAMHQRSTSDLFLGASLGHAPPCSTRCIRHACPGATHRVSAPPHRSTWSRSYSSSLPLRLRISTLTGGAACSSKRERSPHKGRNHNHRHQWKSAPCVARRVSAGSRSIPTRSTEFRRSWSIALQTATSTSVTSAMTRFASSVPKTGTVATATSAWPVFDEREAPSGAFFFAPRP
jgi:hypothetical protein